MSSRSLTRRLYAGVAALGVVFGAVAGGLSLVDWVGERFKEVTPAVIDARIRGVQERDTREPLGDYLRETRQETSRFTAAELDQRGYVFNVDLEILGEVGKKLGLRWSMYRAAGEERLRGPTYNQVAADVHPKSQSHSRTWPVWVPYPPSSDSHFVRFTLEDEKRRPVSEVDTDRFRPPAG